MTPQRFVFPLLAHSSQTSAIGELGVIGKIATASLKRKATEAAASLPSTVIWFLPDVSPPLSLPIADCRLPIEIHGHRLQLAIGNRQLAIRICCVARGP